MLLFIICEAPQKISTIFKPFLAIFTLFHLKNWQYLQKPEFGNLAKTRFWLLLVNNSLCSIPLSCARSEIKETPGDRCVYYHHCITSCCTLCRSCPHTACTPWPPWWGRPQCIPTESQDMTLRILQNLQNLSFPVHTTLIGLFWYSYDHHLSCSAVFWLVVFLSHSQVQPHSHPHPRSDLL